MFHLVFVQVLSSRFEVGLQHLDGRFLFSAPARVSLVVCIILLRPDNSLLAQILHRPPKSGTQMKYVDHVIPR